MALAGFDLRFLEVYRDRLKGVQILLSNSQAGKAEKFSKSRKKFLATTYKPFSRSLYCVTVSVQVCNVLHATFDDVLTSAVCWFR